MGESTECELHGLVRPQRGALQDSAEQMHHFGRNMAPELHPGSMVLLLSLVCLFFPHMTYLCNLRCSVC